MIKVLNKKIEKFEPGKRYIFDLERYKKVSKTDIEKEKKVFKLRKHWAEECDQKEILLLNSKTGEVKETLYYVDLEWCKEIIEVKETNQKPLTYSIDELYNLKGMFQCEK